MRQATGNQFQGRGPQTFRFDHRSDFHRHSDTKWEVFADISNPDPSPVGLGLSDS